MPRRCDLWRVGIVHKPVEALAREGLSDRDIVSWFDTGRPFTFDADPFGYWRDDCLHVFVEHYDYRSRRGVIDCIALDEDFQLRERRRVLEKAWHLSYPAVFEGEGELWMLPEAHRSGALTIYRCRDFPFDWERAFDLPLPLPAIDATPFHHEGLWWLFFSSAESRSHRMGSLHIMTAPRLAGPWQPVGPQPFLMDDSGARPGGLPFRIDGRIILPVQDCSRTYGGAIRLLQLSMDMPPGSAGHGTAIRPLPAWQPFDQGLHTLNGCGPVTLIDAKRIDRTGRGWLLDAKRMFSSL